MASVEPHQPQVERRVGRSAVKMMLVDIYHWPGRRCKQCDCQNSRRFISARASGVVNNSEGSSSPEKKRRPALLLTETLMGSRPSQTVSARERVLSVRAEKILAALDETLAPAPIMRPAAPPTSSATSAATVTVRANSGLQAAGTSRAATRKAHVRLPAQLHLAALPRHDTEERLRPGTFGGYIAPALADTQCGTAGGAIPPGAATSLGVEGDGMEKGLAKADGGGESPGSSQDPVEATEEKDEVGPGGGVEARQFAMVPGEDHEPSGSRLLPFGATQRPGRDPRPMTSGQVESRSPPGRLEPYGYVGDVDHVDVNIF